MAELSDPAGVVALVAAGAALIALVLAIVLAVRLSRLRSAQRTVPGGIGEQDLVAHAAGCQQDLVEEIAARLDARVGEAEQRLDGALAYRSLVRYDAYGELSGHQSTTIALLDAERNGVVLSAIAHRDSARLYCKQVVAGEGEL